MKGLIRKPATAESPRCAGATAGAALGIRRLGVTLTRGTGRITSSVVSGIEGRQIGHRDLAVATGSRPAVPPVKGLDKVAAWTSDQALSAPARPASLMVSGGGAVGCELAQAHAGFGVAVIRVKAATQLVSGEDAALAHDFGCPGLLLLAGRGNTMRLSRW